MTTKRSKTDSNFGRRPLARLAGDVRRGTQAATGRLLADTGRRPVEVAAFASSV